MDTHEHAYLLTVEWTGDLGTGTSSYRTYERRHEIASEGKPSIVGSSDPAFRGDPARWNPEELLVASLSACHMLWYLNLCANARIAVTSYVDHAEGYMVEEVDGGGHFRKVVLRPRVKVTADSDPARALELHHEAHAMCFIARSVNFPVANEPTVVAEGPIGRHSRDAQPGITPDMH
ncbi:MAG: OsmC family protein [Gemmatimonadaceae bacterium]|nr:OsmC family protein [Gloeobacterales cyanobacterium ES-bin-141]